MKLLITSLEIHNVRRFSDLSLNFLKDDNQPYKNIFLMMGNGTGKTTTLTLIKGLLSGDAEHWDSKKVKSFKHKDALKGTLKLSVRFDNINYVYLLELDYESGKATTYSSSTATGGFGQRRYPLPIESLFTTQFVDRFVFDGEQPAKALDNTSNEAEEAIKYLYRLDVFDRIKNENERILDLIQGASSGTGTERAVTNLRTRKNNMVAQRDQLKNQVAQWKEDVASMQEEKKQYDEKILKIDKQYTDLNEKKVKAQEQIKLIQAEINATVTSIQNEMKKPYLLSPHFSEIMIELGSSMQKLKLPKTISKDFFKELANAKYCICGREICKEQHDKIIENSEAYLGSDDQSILNQIKSSLTNSEFNETLINLFQQLSEQRIQLRTWDDKLKQADEELKNAGGAEADEARQKSYSLGQKIYLKETDIDDALSTDENNPCLNEQNNIHRMEIIIDEYKKKISETTNTVNAAKRKEVVDQLVDRIIQTVMNKIKSEVVTNTNAKLSSVIADDDVQIESISRYIALRGKSGASEGQILSIAYCFLGTLFENSELQFPFIIDSPAGKMDLDKRKSIAKIVPSLFNQMLAFVTSAEVDQFANQFYKDINSAFFTIIARDDDIIVSREISFFNEYQQDSRENE